MILFFNVLITNNRNSGPNRIDRLDLFKYVLASYSCIDRITDIIIYAELDNDYKNREIELRDYIYLIFENKKVEFYNFSPCNQRQWQKALDNSIILTTKQPILYSGDDDHVFIDYELNGLYEGLDLLINENQDQINTLHFTSWPESISTIYNFEKLYGIKSFEHKKLYWISELLCGDAIQIVNNTFFKHIFFNLDMKDIFIRRTSGVFLTNWYPTLGNYKFSSNKEHPKVKRFTPLREMARHFDSYFHVNMPFSHCPPLNIPYGFFQNNIKINYCGKRKNEFYNINPLAEKYFIEDESGTDDKKMIEDLPLFWKNKITDIEDYSHHYLRQDLINGRNLSHKKIITAPHHRTCQTKDWGISYYEGELDLEEKYIKVGYRE